MDDRSFFALPEMLPESSTKQKGGSCRKVSFSMPSRMCSRARLILALVIFFVFNCSASSLKVKRTPGSKIISLIDDPVGEVFADIKVIGQRGSTLTEQSIL